MWAPWRAVAARILWHFYIGYIGSGERMARRGAKGS